MAEIQLHFQENFDDSTDTIEPVLNYGSPSQLKAPLAQKESANLSSSDATDADTESESETDEFEQCDCITETITAEIPYTSIYENEKEVIKRGYFTQPPAASIVHAERDTSHSIHLVDRYIYTIEVQHGKHSWLLFRRYSDFRNLNSKLLIFRATENLAAPVHRFAERRRERRLKAQTLRYGREQASPPEESKKEERASADADPNTVKVVKTVRLDHLNDSHAGKHQHEHRQKPCKLPHFPILPDTAVSQEKLEQRKEELGRFLSAVLHVPAYRNHHETLEFLGVSRLSFVSGLGLKNGEGFIKKSPGGENQFHGIKRYCITCVAPWRKRWLVAKDSYLVYLRPKHQEISEVLLFDNCFKLVDSAGGNEKANKKIVEVSNTHRTLRIKCQHDWEADQWRRTLSTVQDIGSIWLRPNRFQSTYPTREDSIARWFVDGRSFMEEASSMMELAKEDIFITDWWLSPEIFMKRPPANSTASPWRLDLLLKRKAEQGVKIFVLLYKEVTYALTINSWYTKIKLQSLHPNIKVLRHRGAMNWAHHEKLIIIDQSIAFVGGIDLCFGRWDDHRHRLTDTGGMVVEQTIQLQDDSKLAGKLFEGLVSYEKEAEKQKEEELKKERRGSRSSERGWNIFKKREDSPDRPPPAEDKMEPLIEPGMEKGRRMSRGLAYLAEWRMKAKRHKKKDDQISEDSDEENEDGVAITPAPDIELSGKEKWWVGKDYVNFIHKDFLALEAPFDDFIDRTNTPRMPWHDIASVVYGSAARDVSRHFIERWNACKVEKCHDDQSYPFLLPKSYQTVDVPRKLRRKATACKIQIIRSASAISTGRCETEDSIHQAYVHAIEHAQHYVYIENQFFVSQIGAGKVVMNKIAQALFDRIVRAHKNNEAFRVYVVMPLLPGFEVGTALFTVLHWTYLSISKGAHSILRNLETAVGDPSRYITFCSLRKHDAMGERLITELIYIHSKLLIVDDRIVIIGSANINDRSQMGDRDSEVAIYAEDTQFDQSVTNEIPYQSGKFAGSLRRQLFKEHLGLLDDCPIASDEHSTKIDRSDKIDITDPASETFFSIWKGIAAKNASLFEEIFDCLPNDNIRSQNQLLEYRPGNAECVTDKKLAKQRMKEIRGFLVAFPLNFLIDSDLTPPLTTKEGWAPSTIFI